MKFNGKNLIPSVREERVFRITFPFSVDIATVAKQIKAEEAFEILGYEISKTTQHRVLFLRTDNQDLSEELVSFIILKYGGLGMTSQIEHIYAN